MKIGFDGNEANVEKKLGVGEFSYQLLKGLAEFAGPDLDLEIYVKNSPRPELPSASRHVKYHVVGPKKAWTQVALPVSLLATGRNLNVFFTPTHYAPRFSPVPTVVSILDLGYIFYSELFTKNDLYKLQKWSKYSIEKASKIITISESTKNDIIKQYGVPEAKIAVIYPGIKPELSSITSMNELQKKYGISKQYILFVGTLQPRKNIARLIEAFSKIVNSAKSTADEMKDLELVIIGKKGWQYEDILAAPEKFNVTDSVKFLDFVTDEDLPGFYKNALFFVLPSLYEGFGLPVLEAMKYRCPVLTSNISSLPEAGGDAALYCDPENVEDITKQMKKLLGSSKLREELGNKGLKHIKSFSWDKAAKETLEVLKEVGRK